MHYQSLNILYRYGKDFTRRKSGGQAINGTEFLLCQYICSNPGCSQEQAARSLQMDKTTAARALYSLEEKGYLLRQTDTEDHRKKFLQLTESGQKSISEMLAVHEQWVNRLMSVLDPEEQTVLETCITKLLKQAEALQPEQL